jgi:hypothetical protein
MRLSKTIIIPDDRSFGFWFLFFGCIHWLLCEGYQKRRITETWPTSHFPSEKNSTADCASPYSLYPIESPERISWHFSCLLRMKLFLEQKSKQKNICGIWDFSASSLSLIALEFSSLLRFFNPSRKQPFLLVWVWFMKCWDFQGRADYMNCRL